MFDERGGNVANVDEGTKMGIGEPGNDPRGDCGGSVSEGSGVGGLGEGGGWIYCCV